MKRLKHFKILFRYLKEDKLLFTIYLVFSILRYFEPLLNAFIWANALEAISKGNERRFIIYLVCWSGVIILCWVLISLPVDLIYNKLEKKFMSNVNKDLYRKVSNLPAVAYEEIGVGEFINRMYTDPDRVLELLQKLIKLLKRHLKYLQIDLFFILLVVKVSLHFTIRCLISSLLSEVNMIKFNELSDKEFYDLLKERTTLTKYFKKNVFKIFRKHLLMICLQVKNLMKCLDI